MVMGLTLLLFSIALILAFITHKKGLMEKGFKKGLKDFLELLPRLAIGVIGSGFIAALLPQAVIKEWLGEGAGIFAYLLAFLSGVLTPGGPVVGYALGFGALKAGAAPAIIICYVSAWGLMQIQRVLMWEIALLGVQLTKLRIASSLSIPFIMALIYLLKP